MNVPVFGVALGVPLAKASTGPFAQFQNCGDDPDSLTKLVSQLMCRISGAELDPDTVKMQVGTFKNRITEIQKNLAISSPEEESELGAEESVAKLFEEVKVMFRDLPARIQKRVDSPSGRKTRLRPDIMFHLAQSLSGTKNEELGFLLMISIFKEDVPWLYELGLDVYRSLSVAGKNHPQIVRSMQNLRRACDQIVHEPFFREILRDEELVFSIRELRSFLDHWEPSAMRPDSK